MELYDIVDNLNKVIKLDGRLILSKSITTNKKFPIYKEFNYVIWNVRNSTDKVRMLTQVENINTYNLNLVECWEVADRNFLVTLLRWIAEGGYNNVNEQVSDRAD